MKAAVVLVAAAALLLSGCSGAVPTPVVVTVERTVPVEVTRMVEVLQTVEVIREVSITEIVTVEVQVPVTVTPQPSPEATATVTPLPTADMLAVTPGVPAHVAVPTGPYQKVAGLSLLKLTNNTDDTLSISINGPQAASITVAARGAEFVVVPDGAYTYRVFIAGQPVYSGDFTLNNPDKYELKIQENKVVFLTP
jgi:hypothetical protein